MSEYETIEINVSDEEVEKMIALGFCKRGDDGVLELTPEGNDWVLAWCKKKIADHG